MLATTLITLFAAQALGTAVYDRRGPRVTREREVKPIDTFLWKDYEYNTGVNWKDYIQPPAEGVPEKFTCIRHAGTDPQDCASAFAAWDAEDDESGTVDIPGGECVSITASQCEATVCAPLEDLSIDIRQITGRFWNPLQIRCIMGGTGGIFQSADSKFVIGVGRTVQRDGESEHSVIR